MKKVYLLGAFAALTVGMTLSSCNKEDFSEQPTEAEAVTIAEEVLGVTIDPNQDWNMTQNVTANVTVNMDYGEKYIVTVYSNDPLVDKIGYELASGTIENGQTFTAQVVAPKAKRSLVIGIANSKGFTYYKSVPVDNGNLNTQFGTTAEAPAFAPAFTLRRSNSAPSVPDITIPDANYVNTYLEGAKEPNATNTTHDNNNSHDEEGSDPVFHNPIGDAATVVYGGTISDKTLEAFVLKWIKPYFSALWWGGAWTVIPGATDQTSAAKIVVKEIAKAGYNFSDLINGSPGSTGGHIEDEDWVTKFKIEAGKSWDDFISVLASEGLTDNGQLTGRERTVVVKGTWNLNKNQRVGSRGQVIIASGGILNISSGCTLELVNQSRLVVMPGAIVQGAGNIMITNGNEAGFENYNGGTINITGTFNNNFGKFYNYNFFKCNTYKAGGGESNFYNHGVAHIKNGGTNRYAYESTNARIFNACQWYCEDDMRAYIIEMTSGSYFYVGGQLEMSCGTDGSNDPTYVAMAEGAYMQVGDLDNNNTSWVGPTSGYAVLETGSISYLNWTGSEPITDGYIINNIAVSVDDTTVGAGMAQGTDTYVALRDYILNGYGSTGDYFDPIGKTPSPDGNGGAVLVSKGGANLELDAATGFVAGQSGCTPGYNGTPIIIPQDKLTYSYAFEDTRNGDYDMNDVVIKVRELDDDKIELKLVALGAMYDLKLRLYNYDPYNVDGNYYGQDYVLLTYNDYEELHDMLGAEHGALVNTDADANAYPIDIIIDKNGNDYTKLRLALYVPAQYGNAAYEIRLSGAGEAPYGVIIPTDWQWPKERVNVMTAYPDLQQFIEGNATIDWYSNPYSSASVVQQD